MSGKCFGLASLVAAVLGLGSVQAQGPDYTAPGAPSSRAAGFRWSGGNGNADAFAMDAL